MCSVNKYMIYKDLLDSHCFSGNGILVEISKGKRIKLIHKEQLKEHLFLKWTVYSR